MNGEVMGRVSTEIFAYYFGSSAHNYIWTFFLLLECLLMLPDLASVFTPSADDTLLPLSLPKALGGNLLTHSSPPRGATTVDMRAFDEDMAASNSSVSSKPKRERDSPSKKALLGTEVRILSLRKGAFLLSSMGVPGAIFYRGVRKMGSSRLFAACSILFFGAWC